MFNLILFGPPGSGKGTQSEKLIARFGLKHLSTGDLLRSEIAKQTALGVEAKKVMDKGELVPDEVVIGMISSAIDHNENVKGFLFDGFPRTATQAEALDKLTSGRSDDTNESVIRARIAEYHKKTAVVADYYRKFDKVTMVEGEGSIDEIFSSLCEVIDSRI